MCRAEETPKEPPLKQMARTARQIAQELWLERHDLFVRLEQKSLEEKLDRLIAQAEQQGQKQEQNDKQKQQEQRKQRMQQLLGQKPSQGTTPKSKSEFGPPTPPDKQLDTMKTIRSGDNWAKLPKMHRDELMQTFGSEMPERWRKRLEAYFISIAAEEVKDR